MMARAIFPRPDLLTGKDFIFSRGQIEEERRGQVARLQRLPAAMAFRFRRGAKPCRARFWRAKFAWLGGGACFPKRISCEENFLFANLSGTDESGKFRSAKEGGFSATIFRQTLQKKTSDCIAAQVHRFLGL
jgi:hypothetical protein